MNHAIFTTDDPRLTAYALGELEGGDLAAVEAAVRHDPALRAAVDEIRLAAAQLEAALAAEAVADISPADPVASSAAALAADDEYRRSVRSTWRQMGRFPQIYYVVGGLAAACFAVMVVWRGPAPKREAKRYVEVSLPPASGAMETDTLAVAADSAAAATTPALPETQLAPRLFEGKAVGLLQLSRKFADEARAKSPPAALPPEPNAVPSKEERAALRTASRVGGAGAVPMAQDNTLAASLGAGATLASTSAAPPSARAGAVPRNAPAAAVGAGPFSFGAGAGPLGVVGGASGQAGAVTSDDLSLRTGAGRTFDVAHSTAGPVPSSGLDLYGRARPEKPSVAPAESLNTESYAVVRDNDFLPAAQNPFSTFSIHVDSASYANVRRFIEGGRLPPAEAVRVEELVNYFPYQYPAPGAKSAAASGSAAESAAAPFAATLEVAEAPWAPTHRLVRIGLKGRELAAGPRAPANLVFLLDVSGSMNEPNKLPLVKESLRLLLGKLQSDDRVAIVTYAGSSGLALPSTPVAKAREIHAALDALTTGGATNGGMGIQLAYDVAKANFTAGGANRIILCTDGDFNVGVATQGALATMIEERAKSGVFLTVLGFGMGNLKDATLELLAARGNGNYGYIDTRREAEKLLVEQVNGTLLTIAKDVKIQVDFNPAKVASYRLIGYENRQLKKEDFNDDRVDAGEIGAGHTVTALYEIVPVGVAEPGRAPPIDASKYGAQAGSPARGAANAAAAGVAADELLTVKLRYKEPAANESKKLEFPLTDTGRRFADASADFRFAAAVAAFGMILRDSPHKGTAAIGDVVAWAAAASARSADDRGGYRSDFVDLARKAQALLR